MTKRPPQKRGGIPASAYLLLGLAALCLVASLTAAALETLTPLKPISFVVSRAVGGVTSSEAMPVAATTTRVTFTPTISPIPPTATHTATAIPTATLSPTDTPIPTDAPIPTETSTPADTPTPTETLAPTATATATVNQTAIASARQTATTAARRTPTPTVAAPKATNTPRPPAPANVSGRIAFPVFNAASNIYDIYLANSDGSSMAQVMGAASQPCLSPDGSVLAFRRWKSDERGLGTLVFGGEHQRRTNFLEDAAPVFADNGGDIVFFSRREVDRQPRVYRLSVHSAGDSVLTRDGLAVFGETPVWLPDGRIVYGATYPHKGLAVMNGDGSNVQIIHDSGDVASLAVAPGGGAIAFMSERDGNWEVYRIAVDGSGLRRLTNNAANDGLPAWSPDGRSIAFVSDRGGEWGMWVMNADGGSQRQLFALPGPIGPRPAGEPDFVWLGWWEERISWRS